MIQGRRGNWNTRNDNGQSATWDAAHLEVLLDLRDLLDRIASVLECRNTRDVPNILRRIAANTSKPLAKASKRKGRK